MRVALYTDAVQTDFSGRNLSLKMIYQANATSSEIQEGVVIAYVWKFLKISFISADEGFSGSLG